MSPRQMALDLVYNPQMGRADFILTSENIKLLQHLDAWQGWEGKATILIGPKGCGKTHLATIWAESAKAPIIELNQVDSALLTDLAQSFTLCCENVISGSFSETDVFHLLNLLRARGGALLITSQTHPSEWGVSLPDLASRLRAIPVLEMGEPDEVLLEQLIIKLFADRQLEVSPDVARYLAVRMERSAHFAHALVEAIDKQALAARAKVTKQLAGRVLNELMPEDPNEPRLPGV